MLTRLSPVRITSGYRAPKVNRAIGGTAELSGGRIVAAWGAGYDTTVCLTACSQAAIFSAEMP